MKFSTVRTTKVIKTCFQMGEHNYKRDFCLNPVSHKKGLREIKLEKGKGLVAGFNHNLYEAHHNELQLANRN